MAIPATEAQVEAAVREYVQGCAHGQLAAAAERLFRWTLRHRGVRRVAKQIVEQMDRLASEEGQQDSERLYCASDSPGGFVPPQSHQER
jgi:hypothetical protein